MSFQERQLMKIAIVGDPHISTGFRARIDDYLRTVLRKIKDIALCKRFLTKTKGNKYMINYPRHYNYLHININNSICNYNFL